MRNKIYDIDTELLLKAMLYYQDENFKPLSSPLLVSDCAVNLTLPKDVESQKHLGLNYVGSAEQSFYELLKDSPELSGEFMLISPCQRNDIPTETNLNIFLKLELISTTMSREEILEIVLKFYLDSFSEELFRVIQTSEGFDINMNGVEICSFGSRFINNRWISYGTGLALPRISYALQKSTKQE